MKIKAVLMCLLLFSVLAVPSFAQSGEQNETPASVTGQQGSESQKCTDVTKKVGQVTEMYNKSQEKYMNTFQNSYQEMHLLALKLKTEGYDTEQFEENLNEYNTMIQNANRYYNEFRTGIDNAKKGVCGNSDADAGQEFNSARTQLMNCKEEMLQLRTFAQETLRKDLVDLKNQISE